MLLGEHIQDKRGGTITVDFVAGSDDASTVESVDPSVPDTPMVNSNPGQSKYGHTYRCISHYDPMAESTIGAKATALANYYQCLKDTYGEMEFTNVEVSIGGGFMKTLELKPKKYKEAINWLDRKAWEKIKNEHDHMDKMIGGNQ